MLKIITVVFIIYAIIQVPFILRAAWDRRQYQKKIRDGQRQNQQIMKKHKSTPNKK